MIEEYKRGRTPNPDVMCNKYVKFGAFLRFALESGADYVATGHYAMKHESGNMKQTTYELLAGADTNKDQSYFLWTLTQEQLAHILFPVGHLPKPEVRKLAQKFGLPTAEKKDSQGVCFLGPLDMGEFLKHYSEPKRGDVLNEEGEAIGFHEGAILYTLGQRHGFTIIKKRAPTGARESPNPPAGGVGFRSSVVSRTNDMENSIPYFVVKKDMRENTITVAHKEQGSLKGKGEQTLLLENINWIAGVAPDKEKMYSARVRYRGELLPCKIKGETVEFLGPQEPVASGQSLVVYDGDECLGGGVVS